MPGTHRPRLAHPAGDRAQPPEPSLRDGAATPCSAPRSPSGGADVRRRPEPLYGGHRTVHSTVRIPATFFVARRQVPPSRARFATALRGRVTPSPSLRRSTAPIPPAVRPGEHQRAPRRWDSRTLPVPSRCYGASTRPPSTTSLAGGRHGPAGMSIPPTGPTPRHRSLQASSTDDRRVGRPFSTPAAPHPDLAPPCRGDHHNRDQDDRDYRFR